MLIIVTLLPASEYAWTLNLFTSWERNYIAGCFTFDSYIVIMNLEYYYVVGRVCKVPDINIWM